METVTIKGQDFTLVHNAICELRTVQERLTGVLNEELAARLHSVILQFEQGLEDAYSQDDAAFEDKMEHYSTVQQELGLEAIWSMFEVQDLNQPHPYAAAREILYKDHWGAAAVSEPIEGPTWRDIYSAADRCIRGSGDDHHIFIEALLPVADQPHQLRLTTGS
jgi:hypothetical protein